jgi:hypothetical protein
VPGMDGSRPPYTYPRTPTTPSLRRFGYRCVLPDGPAFEQCWPVLRKYFGEIRPAAMMISAGLADPRMKIEIEGTALKGLG